MKKTTMILLAMVLAVLMTSHAWARGMGGPGPRRGPGGMGPEPLLYVSAGASLNLQNFDFETAPSPDYDDAGGLSLAIGARANPYLAAEFSFDWLASFDRDATYQVPGGLAAETDSVDLTTYMGVLKVSPMGNRGPIDVYGLWGLGLMHGEAEQTVSGALAAHDIQEEDDWCSKIGLGLDFQPPKSPVGFGMESAYIWGLGDLDTIRYTQVLGKLIFRF